MTAQDYLADPDFRAFLFCWERDRRCPIGLVDWFLERDEPGLAAAATWAVEVKDRPIWMTGQHDKTIWCGLFPCLGNGWFWNEIDPRLYEERAHHVPWRGKWIDHDDPQGAIIWYLDEHPKHHPV